ncbi:homoserine O-acetyltransferase [Aquibacillus koreensis]|uniref:Homoserine O-acetyltransferase n=1 Tax=Aquibacillus koreensis TaxID=279446 RepID=A0A9X4AIA0_9BACI|nr:homoserine O-acetyltransferase [Aquibacillus koreensis]MCT2536064.1 homoserine O-acetyltransferase [Aquibacillus koreensis]MDC3420519.1 homoserine O-acetyltransferase [Aquibacillus koreensis]
MNVKVATRRESGIINIGDLELESGKVLSDVQLAYERVGSTDLPVILVCHALTGTQYCVGSEDAPGYWANLINHGGAVDLDKFQVISFNVIGGCHGSTGPLSINPETGKAYQTTFPFVTIRDIVKAQYLALKKFDIDHLKAVIGGSLGGMQVLEWGISYPEMMDGLFPIAVTPYLNDYAIAFNNIARLAILQDPKWNNGNYAADDIPEHGLSLARMVGMITYRSSDLFNERFGRELRGPVGVAHEEIAYEIESYLDYQGKKLTKRFDANSYLYLLKAMDTHDVGRERDGMEEAAKRIEKPLYAIGYAGDLLFPTKDLEQFVELIQQTGKVASFDFVPTQFGHDGFLVEFEKWGHLIKDRLEEL